MCVKKRIRVALAGILLGLSVPHAMADVVLIVSAKSSVGALRPEQVSDIFLGKVSTFPARGDEAVPLDQQEDSAIREEFYSKLTGKSLPLLKAYWSKLIFAGKGQPPREVPSGEAVKKLVADNPKYIGYIDSHAVDDSVKAVLVLR